MFKSSVTAEEHKEGVLSPNHTDKIGLKLGYKGTSRRAFHCLASFGLVWQRPMGCMQLKRAAQSHGDSSELQCCTRLQVSMKHKFSQKAMGPAMS